MGTPLAVDLYSRTMADMQDERKLISVSTVGQSFFGRPQNGGSNTIYSPDANSVEIDIIRGNERVAALINRGSESRNISLKDTKTQKFTNSVRQFPLGEEIGNISSNQLINRMAGENPYAKMSRETRNRFLALEHHEEHVRRFARLFEVLSWQSLLTGKMDALLGTTNSDLQYDFRRNSSLTITPTVPWDNASADIFGDIDAGCDALREIGHVTPNFMFMGGDVAPVFFNDTTIQKFADLIGYAFIAVGPNNPVPANLQPLVDGGATARGMIFTPKGRQLWLFVYNDGYTDDDGDFNYYMPKDTVFLGYYGARADRYFGPSDTLPLTPSEQSWYMERFGFDMTMMPAMPNIKNQSAVITPAMFYFDAYQSSDRKKVSIRTQTAPIFATTQTDAYYVMNSVLEASS